MREIYLQNATLYSRTSPSTFAPLTLGSGLLTKIYGFPNFIITHSMLQRSPKQRDFNSLSMSTLDYSNNEIAMRTHLTLCLFRSYLSLSSISYLSLSSIMLVLSHPSDVLSISAESDFDYTPSPKVRLNYSPISFPAMEWHYAAGHWIECDRRPFTQYHSFTHRSSFHSDSTTVGSAWTERSIPAPAPLAFIPGLIV